MMNYLLGFVIWGMVAFGLGGLGVFLLVKSLKARKDLKKSQSWPFVVGHVTDVSVKIDGDAESGKFRYLPVVNYAYDIDSKIYDSDKISFGHGPMFNSQQSVDKFLVQYAPGEDVKIFYDPSRPKNAVLRRELEGTKASFITGVVLIMVMAGMMLIIIKFLPLIN